MNITNNLTVHLDEKRLLPPVDAVQGDDGRTVAVSLYVAGVEWTVPTNASIAIRYRRPDGAGGVYDTLADGTCAWSVSGNIVTVALAPIVLALAGRAMLQIALLDETSVISTFSIPIHIEEDPSAKVSNPPEMPSLSLFRGECVIALTVEDGAYVADKTVAEIDTAYAAGHELVCTVPVDEGLARLPLVHVTNDGGRMTYIFGGTAAWVESSSDVCTVSVSLFTGLGLLDVAVRIDSPSGGAEDFHVYVEGAAGGKATVADGVNWYMIKTAHDAGRRCVCHWTVGVRTFHLPLIHDYRTNSNEHFYFSGIIDGYLVAKVHFSSAGAVDLSMAPFPQATRFLIQRSGDNYSILNSFDGEQLENAYSNTRLSAEVPSMIICSLQVTEDPISYMELPLVSRRELSGGDIYYVFSGTGEIDGQTFVFTVRMTNHGGVLSFTVEQRQIPEGLYIVNVTSDESGVYSSDKSYEEVLAVHNAGVRQIQCKLHIGDWYYSLPLCGTVDGTLAYGGSASTMSVLVMQSESGVFVILQTLATQTDIDSIDVLIGGDS